MPKSGGQTRHMRGLGHRRAGRPARDAPARQSGDGGKAARRLPLLRPVQQESRHARRFGRQLQAAGGDGGDLPHFPHHAGKTAMAQRLLHHRRDRPPGGDIENAVGAQPDIAQSRGVKIRPFGYPQNRPLQPGQNARRHQPGRRRKRLAGTVIGQFMQSGQAQPAPGQMPVQGRDAEGQHGPGRFGPAQPFQTRDRGTQVAKLLVFRNSGHAMASSEQEHNVNIWLMESPI